jgi:hypothetical protein
MAYGDVFERHSQRMRNETAALVMFALGLFGIANQRQRAEAEIKTALLSFLFLFGGTGTGGSQGFFIPFLITLLFVAVKAEAAFSSNFFTGSLIGCVFYYFGFMIGFLLSFLISTAIAVTIFYFKALD